MPRIVNIAGQRFGRLTALALHPERERYGNHYCFALWICRCDCGTECIVRGGHLRGGKTMSCGCLQRERVTKHGRHDTPAYCSWRSMKKRCLDPRHCRYPLYGGRGIAVCEEWLDFKNFYTSMCDRPNGQTLDRINSNGNYEPGNCRWATAYEQTHNRRPSRRRNDR
jgi:hypothetical protein